MNNKNCHRCAGNSKYIVCEDCDKDCGLIEYRIGYRTDYLSSKKKVLYGWIYTSKWERHRSTGTNDFTEAREIVRGWARDARGEKQLKSTRAKRTLFWLFKMHLQHQSPKETHDTQFQVKTVFHRYAVSQVFTTTLVKDLTGEDIANLVAARVITGKTAPSAKQDKFKTASLAQELSVIKRVIKWGVRARYITTPTSLVYPSIKDIIKNDRRVAAKVHRGEEDRSDIVAVRDCDIQQIVDFTRSNLDRIRQNESFKISPGLCSPQKVQYKTARALTICRGLLASWLVMTTGIRSMELNRLSFSELVIDSENHRNSFIDVSRVKKTENQVRSYFIALQPYDANSVIAQLFAILKDLFEARHGHRPTAQHFIFKPANQRVGDLMNRRDRKLHTDFSIAMAAVGLGDGWICEDTGLHRRVVLTGIRHWVITNRIKNNPNDWQRVARIHGTSVNMLRQTYVNLLREDEGREAHSLDLGNSIT
jgi:hypothetical protein